MGIKHYFSDRLKKIIPHTTPGQKQIKKQEREKKKGREQRKNVAIVLHVDL